MLGKKTAPRCPGCGHADAVRPLVWGKPGPQLLEQARAGEVVLAGCRLPGEPGDPHPRWACTGCGTQLPAGA